MSCRLCDSDNLRQFLDLGFHPPSDQFRDHEDLAKPVVYYPLTVDICETCGFVQLGHIVPPEILYQDNYPYESSTTNTGKKHFFEFAKSVVTDFGFMPNDLAVDIGSNVGVLLEGFARQGMRIQGVDPASNICELATARGIPTINDFFNKDVVRNIVNNIGRANIVTATNVFAHVDDLSGFMEAILDLMSSDKGLFVVEAPHFLHLVRSLEYDTIYHEHLSYLTVKPLLSFFEKFGLEIIRVDERDIHGGSIRIFIAHKNRFPVHESVRKTIDAENKAGLCNIENLNEFSRRVIDSKLKLLALLAKLKASGKRIVGVSAPAKGMTLLNYCHIDNQILDYVTEKSMLKIGKYTPGGHIPVFGDSKLLESSPDYALLLAWNFAEEIMNNNREYIERGGKFIIPLPEPKII